ncbi:MAG: hypothetical protein Q7S63_01230 [bacterium]|nr:hypothetical protein [bacterium]
MSKKVIDIIRRPKRNDAFEEKAEEKPILATQNAEKPLRDPIRIPRKTAVVFIAIAVLGGGAVAIPVVWGGATVQVRPESRDVSVSKGVSAVANLAQKDANSLKIPAVVLEKEEEGTQLFSSTGHAQKGEYAKGKIKVFNSGTASQTLVANTRFISENGKLFRSQQRIQIVAAKQGTPGSVDVNVVAAEPGDTYNIAPSTFSLPGLAGSVTYTSVYGKSSEAMKGGTTQEVSVVTKEDIEKAKNQLLQSLQDRAKASLKSQLQVGYEIAENGFVIETLSTSSLVKEGAELAQFSSSAKIRVKAFSFKASDLRELLAGVLQREVKEHEELQQETIQMRYEVGTINRASQTMILDSFIQGRAYRVLDVQKIQEQIMGKGRGDADGILAAAEGVLNEKLSLWPFWMNKVPQDKGRIHIEIQY